MRDEHPGMISFKDAAFVSISSMKALPPDTVMPFLHCFCTFMLPVACTRNSVSHFVGLYTSLYGRLVGRSLYVRLCIAASVCQVVLHINVTHIPTLFGCSAVYFSSLLTLHLTISAIPTNNNILIQIDKRTLLYGQS